MRALAVKYKRQHDQLRKTDEEDDSILRGPRLQEGFLPPILLPVPGLPCKQAKCKCLQSQAHRSGLL